MGGVWTFLSDPANRETLGWLGGGAVVAAGGVWAIVKFVLTKDGQGQPSAPPTPTVEARDGGIAVGGSVDNSTLNAGRDAPKTRG